MAATVSPWPETLLRNKKRVIEELIHGLECATQLQVLFHKSSEGSSEPLSAKELVEKILRSFDETLSVLSSCNSAEFSQNQATSNGDSPCCDEDSGESMRKPAATKDKRGCYKRKRDEKTWSVVSTTMEDGHPWRKYGQKDILNCKHPRSYFRCTRKYDQGCRATRQVQRMEDDPQFYQTTYIGTHTCRDSFKAPQIITGSESWESYMVTSGDPKSPTKHHHHQHHHSDPSKATAVKQESKEETSLSDLTELDSDVWKEIMGSDYGDVVSNVYLCNEITEPAEFETDFPFDESEFFQ
ncbi:hypothetical protein DITRI_Ditri18aG0003300 [Diplodiscus trichospermus]